MRATVASDIDAILADVRAADAEEMRALGTTVEAALREGIGLSDWSGTGVFEGKVVCVFGVAPVNVLAGIGAPWMLSTNGLLRARRPFLEARGRVMDAMLATYPRLTNIVQERNTVAVRWLEWMGFKVNPDALALPNGERFRVFSAGDWSNV